MNIRHVLAASAVAGGLLVAGAAPAFAASGPSLPAGCTFDQATGVETCVTSTSVTGTFGPFTTPGAHSGGVVPGSDTFDGATGTQICDVYFGDSYTWSVVQFIAVSWVGTVTTTTTTERHGLNGKVFDTSTSQSASVNSVDSVNADGSNVGCADGH
jgi:hypothetical protein